MYLQTYYTRSIRGALYLSLNISIRFNIIQTKQLISMIYPVIDIVDGTCYNKYPRKRTDGM